MLAAQVSSLIARVRWVAGVDLVAGLLIALVAVLRVAYLLGDCPLELAADEAHYWDWSRHLDWSYYSKGPLVAWLIRASCELFGSLSQQLVGSPLLAIRVPAIACQTLALVGIYLLAKRVAGDGPTALFTLFCFASLPVMAAGGTVMTIDAPYCCAWTWACYFGHAAVVDGQARAWPMLGATLAIGILAKYTMLVWIPSAVMFMVATPGYRHHLRQRGLWIALSIAGLAALPILVWNARNGWVTFLHVGTQAGGNATQWRWMGPIRYVGEQAGLLLFFWFFAWVGAMWATRPGVATDPSRRWLWWMSAPMFGVFLLVSLRTPGQINWPIAAYAGGMILAADWWLSRWRAGSAGYRRFAGGFLAVTCLAGFVASFLLHQPAVARPILAVVSGPATAEHPVPMRRFDPTARLRGWRTLAQAVDDVRRELIAAGEPEPVITAAFWTLPGELGVYCEGHPEVYCIGSPLAQRMSQYDLWRPNPAWDPQEFAGRTMIFVGDMADPVEAAFEAVGPSRYVEHREEGRLINYWWVTVGRGYRGFGPPDVWVPRMKY